METKIVWLEDPGRFEYLREQLMLVRSRSRNPGYHGNGRVVGYACVDQSAKGCHGYFTRRIWWLAPWDPYEDGGHPIEAVIPASIAINRPSLPASRVPRTRWVP